MNLWIVTIGSSDVQLDSNKANSDKGRTEKQRSDKVWQYWYEDTIKAECYDIPFEPKRAFNDSEESYRIAARILGIVYESSSEEVKQEIQNYLTFPLLSNFVKEFKKPETPEFKKLEPPEAIAILLTDQSEIFKDDNERRKPKSPYWQDTCKLEPIINTYLQQEFPDVKLLPLILSPQEKPGLDDWDRVLDLVRDELKNIPLQSEADTVYVSHQAGTPAISSAVQFSSLAKFRKNVRFLVSNEYSQEVTSIPNSTYLKAIQIQEVNALLAQHDYVGIRDILGLTKIAPNNAEEERIKHLLDAAEQWNFAEFQKFKKIVSEHNLFPQTTFPWWKIGYESTYLAWVRLKQGSPVDAMFHSFRAVEGSAGLWAEKKYRQHIRRDPKKGLQLNQSICQSLNNMKSWFEKGKPGQYKQEIGLYGKSLFALIREANTNWQSHPCIAIFCNPIDQRYQGKDIFKERNNLFHRLEGLQNQELFNAWDVANRDEWIARVLCCLNFIAKEDLPQEFTSLEEASLMAKVHDELVEAIKRYELQT
ncbi:hypothetical protein PN499_05060 [Kamptonema animale CS-326]|jgi:hypothetical protein|uniref:hypothetical protein n=1 Tax=Kamptonema animale TaxID=92934 RepID=UPI00232F8840|nr:hypothetical protein [Kamptonema animale]MDB9510547.1 hypothetical protein [Kamptonema animale CS-326]